MIEEQLQLWFSEAEIKVLEQRCLEFNPEILQTKSDYQAVLDGCYYDEEKATRFEQFCEMSIIQVTGRFKDKPLILFDWQKAIFRKLFGWYRADGTRRFRNLYLTVPKKQGKTCILSALALYMLMADVSHGGRGGESNAQCYCVANDRNQAGLLFNHAANFVKASPRLRKLLKVINSTKRITYEPTLSFFRAMSKDTTTADGIDASFVVVDEFHLAASAEMYNTLKYSGAARTQPIFAIITTAGEDIDTICGQEYTYAKKVLNSEIVDTQYLPIIYEATADDDISDPETWRKANPSLDLIIPITDIETAYHQAKNGSQLANFKRRRLNMWIKDVSYWISHELVKRCASSRFPNIEDLAAYPCWFGLDIGDQDDLTALAMVWRTPDSEYFAKTYLFCPSDTIPRRAQSTSIPYLEWAEKDFITTTEGPVTDFEYIYNLVLEMAERTQFQSLMYDPFQANAMATRWEGAGLTCVRVPQTINYLSAPMKLLERLIKQKKIVLDDNPALLWMFANLQTEKNKNGDVRPNKKKSTEKIDGPVAIITAMQQAMLLEEYSLYEGTGIAVA